MQAPTELTAVDVDELATSWINAQPVSTASAEMVMDLQQALSSPATYGCTTTTLAVVAPRLTGLLQGTQTSDVNLALDSEDSGAPEASGEGKQQVEVRRELDQRNSTSSRDQLMSTSSRELDLEQAPAAKRANNKAQPAAEVPSRAVEVNRRAQKRFRLKQKASCTCCAQLQLHNINPSAKQLQLHKTDA